jgi:hypothetical protein
MLYRGKRMRLVFLDEDKWQKLLAFLQTEERVTVYLSIKGYKKPPSFSRLRIIDSRQVGFNCIP